MNDFRQLKISDIKKKDRVQKNIEELIEDRIRTEIINPCKKVNINQLDNHFSNTSSNFNKVSISKYRPNLESISPSKMQNQLKAEMFKIFSETPFQPCMASFSTIETGLRPRKGDTITPRSASSSNQNLNEVSKKIHNNFLTKPTSRDENISLIDKAKSQDKIKNPTNNHHNHTPLNRKNDEKKITLNKSCIKLNNPNLTNFYLKKNSLSLNNKQKTQTSNQIKKKVIKISEKETAKSLKNLVNFNTDSSKEKTINLLNESKKFHNDHKYSQIDKINLKIKPIINEYKAKIETQVKISKNRSKSKTTNNPNFILTDHSNSHYNSKKTSNPPVPNKKRQTNSIIKNKEQLNFNSIDSMEKTPHTSAVKLNYKKVNNIWNSTAESLKYEIPSSNEETEPSKQKSTLFKIINYSKSSKTEYPRFKPFQKKLKK